MLPNISNLDQRIQDSEKFPRIIAAEAAMKANEQRLHKKYGVKKSKDGKKATGSRQPLYTDNPDVDAAASEVVDRPTLFQGYVLNKDVEVARHMPYNEVFYPKLFSENKVTTEFFENGLWMAGFLDRATRAKDMNETLVKKKIKKKKIELNPEINHHIVSKEHSLKPYTKKSKAVKKLESDPGSAVVDPSSMVSLELENIFEIQRQENENAKIIQKLYRRRKRMKDWKYLVNCVCKVPIIQRYFRGMMTRKYVAKWFEKRVTITIMWQAYARRLITRIRLKRSQYYEYNSAVKIQKIIRGKIGRSRHLRLFLDFAITRIQSMWRGTYVTCFLKLHIDYFLRC